MIEKLKKMWNKLKAWFVKNWMIVVNYLVIVLVYNNVYGKEGVLFSEVLMGLWIFASIAYGGYKWFISRPVKKV